jgi:hypothetical protein
MLKMTNVPYNTRPNAALQCGSHDGIDILEFNLLKERSDGMGSGDG